MDAGDVVDGVVGNLVPPEFKPSRRLKFDLTVVIILGVLVMAYTGQFLAAYGFLAFMGISGFAHASDFASQQVQLSSIQAGLQQGTIDRDQRQLCMAKAAKNQAAMEAWSISLQRDISAYSSIQNNRVVAQVRSCDELLIDVGP